MAYSRKLSTDSAQQHSGLNILGAEFEWQNGAACNIVQNPDIDPDWWYPSTGESREFDRKAKAICATCPIRVTCLEKAMANPDEQGTWGGYTEQERHALRRELEDDEG